MSNYGIAYYQSSSGRSPVEDFLDKLKTKDRAKCIEYIEQLEEKGLALPANYQTKLQGEKDLWELRPEWGGVEYRLFFTRADGTFIFVHAIKKKSEKTPKAALDTARRRVREVQEYYASAS